jgi:hypothetical protein
MNDSTASGKDGQHLSDIQIAFVLAFHQAKVTQRTIAKFVKCSLGAFRNIFDSYTFDTFKGRQPQREYQRKTTDREDRYMEHALIQNDALTFIATGNSAGV